MPIQPPPTVHTQPVLHTMQLPMLINGYTLNPSARTGRESTTVASVRMCLYLSMHQVTDKVLYLEI